MKKIKCYKCKGKGYTGIAVNTLAIFLTVGFAALADTEETCDACEGKGYLIEEEED